MTRGDAGAGARGVGARVAGDMGSGERWGAAVEGERDAGGRQLRRRRQVEYAGGAESCDDHTNRRRRVEAGDEETDGAGPGGARLLVGAVAAAGVRLAGGGVVTAGCRGAGRGGAVARDRDFSPVVDGYEDAEPQCGEAEDQPMEGPAAHPSDNLEVAGGGVNQVLQSLRTDRPRADGKVGGRRRMRLRRRPPVI
jgi:hypothetical protein